MKKSLITILILTMALSGLFANGQNESETKQSGKESSTQKITFLNTKGEIQVALEDIADAYKAETGNEVEIIACGAGEVPYTKVTTLYNAGNAPTLSMLDPTDVYGLYDSYALDLSNEKWVSEVGSNALTIDNKVYAYPFCVEGRGFIYNGDAIDAVLGRHVDVSKINTSAKFEALLKELRANGMEYPIFLAKEDWSLGAHQLGNLYDVYEGSSDSLNKELRAGFDAINDVTFNQLIDTLDLEIEYNYFHNDPLGADYDEGAMLLADGTVAFWANGSWAWPNIAEGGAESDANFGFLPFYLGDDSSYFVNNKIQASPSKFVIIDGVQASAEEQQAAKDFLNWLVYSKTGQEMFVNEAALISAAKNNTVPQSNPLSQDIVEKLAKSNTYYLQGFAAPSDHWSVMGAAMQKYIAGISNRKELAKDFDEYWEKQQ